jgi:hypothetical protein
VWEYLRGQPALSGFTLIGGSALALHLKHRLSEDLDLAFSGPELPRSRLEVFIESAHREGFEFSRNDSELAVQEFVQGGMDLHDFQQDFLVNETVKVSLFTPDNSLTKVLVFDTQPVVRLASLPELFQAKCLVSARRSKTRDWLDLYILMSKGGFSWRDYDAAFAAADIPTEADLGWTRLCSGTPQRDDEGYAHLLDSPPALERMVEFFRACRDEREKEAAARLFRRGSADTK